MKCWSCGSDRVTRGRAPMEATIGLATVVTSLPAHVCGACGEASFDADVVRAFELAAAAELARRAVVSPETFRYMRKVVGLEGRELAALLGVTPETVSRWEHGATSIDTRAFALLGGIVVERAEKRADTLERLRAMRSQANSRPLRIELGRVG